MMNLTFLVPKGETAEFKVSYIVINGVQCMLAAPIVRTK